MSEAWDNMRRAKEDSYFDKKNKEAVERLAQRQEETKPRLSPISGEPMEQEVIHGVVIDRCTSSGGVWLDAGELEQLMAAAKNDSAEKDNVWVKDFFKTLTGDKQ